MKLIAKPTSLFMLVLDRAETLHSHRPSVVTSTGYLQNHIAQNRVEVLRSDLPDEATDAAFEKFWQESEGNVELAIESFVSSLDEPSEPPPPPTGDAGTQGTAVNAPTATPAAQPKADLKKGSTAPAPPGKPLDKV